MKGGKVQRSNAKWNNGVHKQGRFGAKDMVQRCGIVGFEPIAKMLAFIWWLFYKI
jgi:hypothetical protein